MWNDAPPDKRYAITSLGKRATYDALGRVTQISADSELGALTNITYYRSGFQARHTNARNKQSTQSHWALDDPEQAQLAGISIPSGTGLPAGMTVNIVRDSFAKPQSITQWEATASA